MKYIRGLLPNVQCTLWVPSQYSVISAIMYLLVRDILRFPFFFFSFHLRWLKVCFIHSHLQLNVCLHDCSWFVFCIFDLDAFIVETNCNSCFGIDVKYCFPDVLEGQSQYQFQYRRTFFDSWKYSSVLLYRSYHVSWKTDSTLTRKIYTKYSRN